MVTASDTATGSSRSRDERGAGPHQSSPPRRVVVAMSGGVDSSVVAALMQAAGHEVIGITLQLYDHGAATGRKGSCCAGEDIHDARTVADRLGIAHYVLDYEQVFERAVIQSFADSYAAGETPVPCIACNREIKFGALLGMIDGLGADVLATGHYVARSDDVDGPGLYRAADADRDQSYFLFATRRSELERLWFPLGGLPKRRVRELARELALPVAGKADSQDICFVPSGRYTDVIARLRPDAVAEGEIVHVDGRVLGRHRGTVNYTVGQRRGLGLAGGEPLFVIAVEPASRRVVVGPRSALTTTRLILRDINWIGPGEPPDAGEPREMAVRVRSTRPPQPATVVFDGDGAASVLLHGPEHGIAKGQACVFYADEGPTARVLGGGFIRDTVRRDEWVGDAITIAGRTRTSAPSPVRGVA